VDGGWRRLLNEELHNLFTSPHIITRVIKSRRMRWVDHTARIGEMRNAYNILIGKPEGKRLLGRSGRIWEYNIKMDLRDIVWEGVDWIHMAEDREEWGGGGLVKTVMNFRVS